uniref:Dynein heavy chain tail domain-containing protein n=1 Tax=Astyanax mexicanus TaxID=7994 RepID=A0A3B1K203_ASTMX
MEDDSMPSSSPGCALPSLPSTAAPSQLYQVCSHQFPPLMQNTCRTLAVPYKEVWHCRTPSESIANNYSPRAQHLKIPHLQHRHTPTRFNPRPAAGDPEGPGGAGEEDSDRAHSERLRGQGLFYLHTLWSNHVSDLTRFLYYIRNGIQDHMLTPQPPQDITDTLQLLPSHLQSELSVRGHFSAKSCVSLCVVDYILLDPEERERLLILSVPRPYPSRVIRAPVPWMLSYREAHDWNTQHLFTIHPIMLHLQNLWINRFSSLRFVQWDDLQAVGLPLLPAEFRELVERRLCVRWRDTLTYEETWLPLVPRGERSLPVRVQELFSCAAALMSLQLRSLVVASLQDLLQVLMNDYTECVEELVYTQRPLLLVKLKVEQITIDFQPSLVQCWSLIQQAFTHIITSAHGLPRVECNLFPELREKDLTLRSVRTDEPFVLDLLNQASEIYQRNTVGPKRYLEVYKKYSNLLDNSGKQEIISFLQEKHSLQIEAVNSVWEEISSLRVTVPLSLLCLEAVDLHDDLCDRTQHLRYHLINHEVLENQQLNRRSEHLYKICSVQIYRRNSVTVYIKGLILYNSFI